MATIPMCRVTIPSTRPTGLAMFQTLVLDIPDEAPPAASKPLVLKPAPKTPPQSK